MCDDRVYSGEKGANKSWNPGVTTSLDETLDHPSSQLDKVVTP